MSHYFITPRGRGGRGRTRIVRARIWGHELTLTSADGVFSADRLDLGTAVLLRELDPPRDRPARFLDLGCGIGPIALGLALECPGARIDAIDVNERAVELTAANARALGLADRITACAPEAVEPAARYDEIWSNPPIRIGKAALHGLLGTWLGRLVPDGVAHLVVGRNLGADSLAAWLRQQGWQVVRVGSAKGFRVLDVTRAIG